MCKTKIQNNEGLLERSDNNFAGKNLTENHF